MPARTDVISDTARIERLAEVGAIEVNPDTGEVSIHPGLVGFVTSVNTKRRV